MSQVRKLLYPFSLLYGGIMSLRNKLYDEDIFKSREFELPVIGVGNLSVGGTGKSPMIEYLIRLLKDGYRVATLSRGYKRSTGGFHLLKGSETAAEVGDEPLQFKKKFPEVTVAVDEDRVHGIEELLKVKYKPEVILLDDVFQHRKVRAGLYILLTSYDNLYSKDLVLPAGNLREKSSGAGRANLVVVTKCPPGLSEAEQKKIFSLLKLNSDQKLFFSSISYSNEAKGAHGLIPLEQLKGFTLITGIANPKPLVQHLEKQHFSFQHEAFPDHHNFKASEVKELKSKNVILTTEKDYMRLKDEIPPEKLFYLPIETRILDSSATFEDIILNYVKKQ